MFIYLSILYFNIFIQHLLDICRSQFNFPTASVKNIYSTVAAEAAVADVEAVLGLLPAVQAAGVLAPALQALLTLPRRVVTHSAKIFTLL